MTDRLRSLDVLRGATVALMILVNNPGSWHHLYPPLAHAGWHGCTPTDLVFPFFLFAVGNALALVLPRLQQGPPAAFWAKLLRRTALMFALGLLLNAAPFVRWDFAGDLVWRDWNLLRTMGVLQRIALCWGAAALIVWFGGVRGAVMLAAALLLGYWAACVIWGDPQDPYGLIGWFGSRLDRAVLGSAHLYRGEGIAFDPEGLASTPPAIAQVLNGWWVGRELQLGSTRLGPMQLGSTRLGTTARAPGADTVVRLFITALALCIAAYVWQLAMPINKKIWTSSYVLLTSGLATAALAALVQGLDRPPSDANGPRRIWGPAIGHLMARGCEVFGQNALFIFVLSGLVPRALSLLRWPDGLDASGLPRFITPLPWLYRSVFADLGSDPRLGSLLFALTNLAAYGALAAWLDRRRIHVRV